MGRHCFRNATFGLRLILFDTRTVGGSNPNEAGWLPIRVEKLKLIIIAVKRV
jgi:hypothetical protein